MYCSSIFYYYNMLGKKIVYSNLITDASLIIHTTTRQWNVKITTTIINFVNVKLVWSWPPGMTCLRKNNDAETSERMPKVMAPDLPTFIKMGFQGGFTDYSAITTWLLHDIQFFLFGIRVRFKS